MCTLCAPCAPLCTIALRFFQNMVYKTVYEIQIQAFTPNFRSLAQQTKKLGEMCTLCTPCALLCTAARYKWCSMILSKLCHSPEELTLKIWEKSLHRDWNWGLDTPRYHKPSIVHCGNNYHKRIKIGTDYTCLLGFGLSTAQCLDLLLGGVSKPQFQSLWRDFSPNWVVSSTGEWYNLGKIMERHLHRAGVHRGAQGAHKVHIFTNFFFC